MSSNVAQFAAKCHRVATTIPRAEKVASNQAGLAIKEAWIGLAARGGLSPTSRVAGARWGVRYEQRSQVKGGTRSGFAVAGTGTSGYEGQSILVRFTGPVHLVFGPTAAHIIAARALGTRKKVRGKAGRLSSGADLNAAFGVTSANRGSFGGLRSVKNGKKALTVGPNMRAYAFHPGTAGKGDVWPGCKKAAQRIAPQVYQSAYRRGLISAGFK